MLLCTRIYPGVSLVNPGRKSGKTKSLEQAKQKLPRGFKWSLAQEKGEKIKGYKLGIVR